ncbi:hypothetical protein PV327_004625 [Microctonus hyperodae]|uniref:C2H2-type domain-containing protein n=1 Tax=Microctonus hyperodae TaxID=165561 RepID=A0AA39FCW8_MICHY|nr:hypothetical protein PV327_004625 [Microctonus hyperodae]
MGVEASPIVRFSSPTANNIMVASTHNLGELILGQYRSNTSERQLSDKNQHHFHQLQHQPQQHHHHHHHHHHNQNYNNSKTNHNHHSYYHQYHQAPVCRPGQTAQDKRSRLSNVINNLRKKVPETNRDSCESDERNSVERNLETLEKYVMTVLNGVIKDAETEGRGRGVDAINSSDTEDTNRYNGNSKKEDVRISVEDDCVNPVVNPEPSEPSAIEPAIPDCDKNVVDKCTTEMINTVEDASKNNCEMLIIATKDFNVSSNIDDATLKHENNVSTIENSDNELSSSTSCIDDKLNEDIRSICRDLLNDLLNDISEAIDTPVIENEEINCGKSITMTGLHCSLPLDKVAQVLPPSIESYEAVSNVSKQVSPKSSPKSTSSPAVRHLCLYCDRKFLSISLRQRHTERVHQLGGGRRSSERNSRKTIHSCQYCSDKCADNLEGLFQHMIACHTDKYHACIQCNTRYSTRETLLLHTRELHTSCDRISESLDKSKDLIVVKEPLHYSTREVCMQRDTIQQQQQQETPEDVDKRSYDHELLQSAITTPTKLNMFARSADKSKDLNNLSSPDFDISFYSSVSCNIRENLLHHLDGKLQNDINKPLSLPDTKQQHNHQSYHELVNPIQFPIDISLTAATPVDSKEYSANDNCDNTSEYAQKAGKMSRLHPRRVSFEKYNFPRKYDGKEQWTCSINDLSKFDIYTQLTLSKKQQMIKEKSVMDRVQQQAPGFSTKSDVSQTELTNDTSEIKAIDVCFNDNENVLVNSSSNDNSINQEINNQNKTSGVTEFSSEFGNFMKLKRWDASSSQEIENSKKIIYAELTGEWSRPRIYICGACTSRHLTLKEMEEHKIFAHPNVWCSHLEFTGDQRELYKHLFLPGRSVPTIKAKNAVLNEKICTKCSKVCGTLAELHRHMLECGGDQAWLLGLFGNGKKKCKWRPFGARSRRRRQRGMKRNISNSQAAPRVNTPKEKAPSGPRVRPSDRESIQKMLANLPAKRSTRRVIQEATSRSRMRKVQTRSRPHLADNTSNTRLSRKTVLRNKLLKNAKSFQRKRCRGDNISAAIESVIINYKLSDVSKRTDDKKDDNDNGISDNKELKKKSQLDNTVKLRSSAAVNSTKNVPSTEILNRVTVLSKKRNVKMETRRSNLKSIGKNTAQINKDIPTSSLTSSSTNSNVKSIKVGLKRSTKETFNVAISQTKVRAQQQNAYQTLSGDNVTTRKRKSTDSLISLNASIKAKSQLRSQDGKFIRNNKLRSVSTHAELSNTSVQTTQTRNTRSDPGPLASRLRLRTVVQQRTNAELSKKMIRVSSDSDKMPTLEPADGLVINEDKDIEQGTNDFPILSPAILATRSCSKVSNNPITKQSDGKTRGKRGNISPKKLDKLNKQNSNNELSTVEKDVGNCDREIGVKNRKSLRRRVSVNIEVNDLSPRHESSCELKSHDDNSDVNRKSFKSEQLLASSNKKNLTSKVVGTRKARQERRAGSLEELSQLQQVPLEVKKLLGPKDDLFTQIGITPTAKIRRNLRQLSLIPKHKTNVTKKSDKVSNEDKDNEPITDSIVLNDKSETNTLRKSPRIEKKDLTDIALFDKSIISDKINNSVESESTLCITNMNDQSTTNITEQIAALGKNRRRGKLPVDLDNINLIGKLPDFINSTMAPVNCPQNYDKGQQNTEQQEDNENEEEVEMISEDKKLNSDNDIKNNDDELPKDVVTADLVSLTLEHLQQESSNSNIDSGKENSSETPINISKPRVTRPKKSRGFKRDRTVKRTLNNVIGILTEGVNIPVEVQQSVVLTVQTSLDNINSNIGLQNNRVEIGDNGIAASNGGGSNIDAIVNENNNDNCSRAIDDSTVNDGKGESASQELQRRANMLIEAQEEAKLDVEQDVNIECSVSAVTANNSLNIELPQESQEQQQSTNDIILDLSRRKPRGKGSFLEKIVSKIAKQKDAMLEGEVGSLLDHAVDELSIILGEVSPTLVDPNDTTKSSLFTADSTENKNDNRIDENKSENPSETNFDEELKINENSMLLNAGSSNNLLSELNFVNDDDDHESMESVKKSDNITTERSSKKRSLDIPVETKNKRKSVDDEKEIEDNRIEEDLCLADIMKLINTTKRESPVMNELTTEKVRPGKRKTADKDCDKSNDRKSNVETSSSTSENNCKFVTMETNKKTKRSDNRKREDEIGGCSEKTKRSSSRRSNSDDNLLTEIVDNKVNAEKNVNEINSTINELNNESPAESASTSIENNLMNNNCQATPEINEKTKKSKKRSKNKKIIVKNDKLNLSDDKSVIDVDDYSIENNTIVQNNTEDVSMSDQTTNQNELITNNVREEQVAITNAEVDDKCSSLKRAFKVPEVLDTSQTVKKRGKKKSSANEHLGTLEVKIATGQNEGSQTRDSKDSCRDESILETSSVCNMSCNGMKNDNNTENITVTVKSRRSSKRKNNDVDGSVSSARSIKENKQAIEKDIKQIDDTLIERRKTLKRKAKENIFLLDDLIDSGDEIDSLPPPDNIIDTAVKISDDKINIEKSENEISTVENNSIVQSAEISHDKKIEGELIVSKSPINDVEIKESENTITDDTPKKRVSGNFAVVHTKSGEILIVEKKKKFTKEVAKFFCEICTTSFTRKSSLKKHNQSQSHLIQMTKCGNDQETQDELISNDDATVSSIDRSEVTTSEEGQDIAIDTSKEETIEQKYENVFESKEKDKGEKVSTENIQAMPATEIPSTSIIDSTDADSTFNCPQLEEDFEDELLDEEICKITENMTHDEYVLTDHVSPMPEATSLSPLKDATDSLLESTQTVGSEQQKINLADEHLDLDSPVLETRSLHTKEIVDDKLQSELKNNSLIHTGIQYKNETYKNINDSLIKSSETKHEIQNLLPNNTKVRLDFSNISEKLKINEFTLNNCKSSTAIDDFESDEDLSATNMSCDIHKLLNETELNIDEKIVETKPTASDITSEISPVIQCENSSLNTETKKQLSDNEIKSVKKKKDRHDLNVVTSLQSVQNINSKQVLVESNRKSVKSIEKSKVSKSKSRMNKSLKKKLANDISSDSDYNDQEEPSSSQNKGKIVKSVFGRALAGEKIDKVKEVLDDWVSRSDSDSRDESRPSSHSSAWRNWKDERKSTHEKSTTQSRSKSSSRRKKNNSSTVNTTLTSSSEFNELSGHSKCRQSKKRAEERISRAFEEESIPYELAYALDQQTILSNQKNQKTSTIYSKQFQNNLANTDKLLNNKTSNDKIGNDFINKMHDESGNKNLNIKLSQPEEYLFPDTNSMESIRTRVPSCPRERSSTPDMISLTTRDSDNDAENRTDIDDIDDNDNDNDDVEDDEEIVRGRLSPLYASNLPESSVDSVVSNSTVDKSNRVGCIDETPNKRRSSSEFSGEKIIIRSTVSSEENRAGVVTIAPTDAIEDNALDMPPETGESTQKSRQGKVLNFDEELFVECCSRLKATTENELRGAKKIKLDHSEGGGVGYRGKDDQNLRTNRGRWRDSENQNSLGSLLESVNQLLGEEMYNSRRTNEHHKRERNSRCERVSPVTKVPTDFIRPDNVGYEDSLDVAFEHNNKLRDKIQQRMRESENLITTSFSHIINDNVNNDDDNHSHHHHHHHHHRHHHRHMRRNEDLFDDNEQEIENIKNSNQLSRRVLLESSSIENKIDSNLDENSTMPYLLDKALSSLFHNNAKHDHNGSTPMNVLAELACAQVPTSTLSDVKFSRDKLSSRVKSLSNDVNDSTSAVGLQQNIDKIDKDQPKKIRNPIKELFERKNEINDRKYHHDKSHSSISNKDCAITKLKTKKTKRHNEFPLIKNTEFDGGLVERKKRRDDRKHEAIIQDKIKDIYDFDEEESQTEYAVNSTMSYRSKNDKSTDGNCTKSNELNIGDVIIKTLAKTLDSEKPDDSTRKRLDNMIERKLQETETFVPKTKGALKAYHVEEKRQTVTGPMDEYIERRGRPRRTAEPSNKHNKSKRRSKNSKKRSRNAWYENDSSDEFVTAIKPVDIGVGISKSQRACSKGKQNLFAELSTSSESEYEENNDVYQSNNKIINESSDRISPELADNYPQEHENHGTDNWMNVTSQTESKNDIEHKKSESDMSDHPLIIDEPKDCDDEQNNSDDDETDNRSEPAFELDDLYREDSSVIGSDCEENNSITPQSNGISENNYTRLENSGKSELIPLEKAIDLLDNSGDIKKINDDTIDLPLIAQTNSITVRNKFSESLDENDECDENIVVNEENKNEQLNIDDDQDSIELPEKLSSNEKPARKGSDNLPLHVFLSRKVQESKKRKEEQLKKMQEKEDENALMEFQSSRRQRKCAIGKQGLLAEISSSDEEYYIKDITVKRSTGDKFDNEKSRRQKRESKEKKKERYMEKKHEQIIAKEQKAIEEEILRELELKKEYNAKDDIEIKRNDKTVKDNDNGEFCAAVDVAIAESNNKKSSRSKKITDQPYTKDKSNKDEKFNSDTENKCNKVHGKTVVGIDSVKKKTKKNSMSNTRKESHTKIAKTPKKSAKSCVKSSGTNRKSKNVHSERGRSISKDDEELRTTKSWNKVEEGVGVAIGRRKRASTNQLYYWSSSSDDDEEFIQPTPVVEEEEDDRQEQHGWIVGDSHKKMITMLAMEKQLKEKRRRSEDEFDGGKSKNKKHRNSTS